ncbi:MAG: superoxide dismutase [Anaerolineaceae bacterium]
MKFLAIEKDIPNVDPELIRCLLEAEALAAWDLKMQDTLREIWFTPDHRAVLMLECTNEEDARRVLGRLPLYRENLIGFEIIPLLPYDGFARLFKKE